MLKKRLTKIMSLSPREEVLDLAEIIVDKYPVKLIKKPAKTLVMLKMRETVAGSEFYLGELLACEAMVEIENKKGMALTAGDDFAKVQAMAVVDAAFNAGLPEVAKITEELLKMEEEVNSRERKRFGKDRQSMVQFRIMEDR